MAVDLVIDIENTPGALAEVATAISDAGVNIAAASCVGPAERAELHILVAARRAREARVGDLPRRDDHPRAGGGRDRGRRPSGVLADLARKIARAGVNLDLVYGSTRNRVVFGAPDMPALKAALGPAAA